jgi:hypothetical protein
MLLGCPLPKEEQSICFSQTRVEHRAKISARVELAIRSPELFAQWPDLDELLSAPYSTRLALSISRENK